MLNLIDTSLTLDDLGAMLKQAKADEKKAQDHRKSIEELIVKTLGAKTEGSSTFNGDSFQLTTTGKLTRSIDDIEGLQQVVPDAIFHRLVNYKPALDLKELRYIEMNEPELYAEIANHITTKPAKTAVAFKALEA